MNTTEILQEVAKAEPKLMAKTAQIVAITERLYPECVKDITNDFATICTMVIEKTASSPPNYRSFGLGIAGVAAGGLASSIATDLYDAAKRGLSKGSNYRRIMEVNPSLKREVPARNLQLAFDALHRFAPDFTADPLIGGALLRQVAELPQMSHKTIVELIGARKDILDAKGRLFSDMARQGANLAPDTKGERDFERAKELELYKSKLRDSKSNNYKSGT